MAKTLEIQVPGSGQAVHTVTTHSDGSCACTCPAWRFQKGKTAQERVCKHILKVAKTFLEHVDAV